MADAFHPYARDKREENDPWRILRRMVSEHSKVEAKIKEEDKPAKRKKLASEIRKVITFCGGSDVLDGHVSPLMEAAERGYEELYHMLVPEQAKLVHIVHIQKNIESHYYGDQLTKCRHKFIETVKRTATESPEALEDVDRKGMTALEWAIKHNYEDDLYGVLLPPKAKLCYIIKSQVLLDTKYKFEVDKKRIKCSFLESIRDTLEKDPDAAIERDIQGFCPLYWAAYNNYDDLYSMLQDRRLPLNDLMCIVKSKKSDKRTVQFFLDKIKNIIDQEPQTVATIDSEGHSPLYWAMFYGCHEFYDKLSSNDLHLTDILQGYSHVSKAQQDQFVTLIKEIIKSNPDAVVALDKDGFSPLYWAVKCDCREIIDCLLDDRLTLCDIFKSLEAGNYEALVDKFTQLVRRILEKNKDAVIETDTNGHYPIYYAAKCKVDDLYEDLLNDCRISITEILHSLEVVKKQSADNVNPYFIEQIEKILAENSQATQTYDTEGHPPLYWATYYKKSETLYDKLFDPNLGVLDVLKSYGNLVEDGQDIPAMLKSKFIKWVQQSMSEQKLLGKGEPKHDSPLLLAAQLNLDELYKDLLNSTSSITDILRALVIVQEGEKVSDDSHKLPFVHRVNEIRNASPDAVTKLDKDSHSPLYWAVQCHCEELYDDLLHTDLSLIEILRSLSTILEQHRPCTLLVSNGTADDRKPTHVSVTGLNRQIHKHRFSRVALQKIQNGRTDCMSEIDNRGHSALYWATRCGCEELYDSLFHPSLTTLDVLQSLGNLLESEKWEKYRHQFVTWLMADQGRIHVHSTTAYIDDTPQSMFYWATKCGCFELYDILSDCDANEKDPDGRSALYWLARDVNLYMLLKASKEQGAEMDSPDKDGMTPFFKLLQNEKLKWSTSVERTQLQELIQITFDQLTECSTKDVFLSRLFKTEHGTQTNMIQYAVDNNLGIFLDALCNVVKDAPNRATENLGPALLYAKGPQQPLEAAINCGYTDIISTLLELHSYIGSSANTIPTKIQREPIAARILNLSFNDEYHFVNVLASPIVRQYVEGKWRARSNHGFSCLPNWFPQPSPAVLYAWVSTIKSVLFVLFWTLFIATVYDLDHFYNMPLAVRSSRAGNAALLVVGLIFLILEVIEEVVETVSNLPNRNLNKDRKMHQRVFKVLSYFLRTAIGNIIDWACYICLFALFFLYFIKVAGNEKEIDLPYFDLMNISLLLVWIRFIIMTKLIFFDKLFKLVTTLKLMYDNVKYFLIVFLCVLIPYTLSAWFLFGGTRLPEVCAQHTAFAKNLPSGCTPLRVSGMGSLNETAITMIRMILVDGYEYDEMVKVNSLMTKVVITSYLCIMAIIGINFLIGLMSSAISENYNRYIDAAYIYEKGKIIRTSEWIRHHFFAKKGKQCLCQRSNAIEYTQVPVSGTTV